MRLSIFALLVSSLAACGGPLGPLSGGKLSGEVAQATPDSWAFAANEDHIQLETAPATDPHSVNVWIGIVDGRAYIPTSLILGGDPPAERQWVKNVLADPSIRLRIQDTVYPAQMRRVTDMETIATVKTAMLTKYEAEVSEQSDGAWVFEVITQ